MTHDSSPAFIASLKRRYLLGLCTIALVSIGAYATLESTLHGMSDDALRLNRAGQQQVISLELLNEAEALHAVITEASRARLRRHLDTLVREHAPLLDGAIRSGDSALLAAYRAVDDSLGSLVRASAAFSSRPDSRPALVRLRTEQRDFLALMGEAAARKQRYVEAEVDLQRRVVRALVIFTAITLLLEALFVFEPAIRSMRALLQRLMGNHDRLQWQACHDTLTGLSNRRSLVERLEASNTGTGTGAVAGAGTDPGTREAPLPFTLYFLDFDGFKTVNDTLGHEVGDRLLVSIAARLDEIAEQFGADDGQALTSYRLGGDEFVLLAIGKRAHTDSDALAHSLVSGFETVHRLGEHCVHSTASVGVFESDGSGIGVSRVLHNADLAMMRAKREGKGRYAFFDRRMRDEEHRRETIEHDLFDALDAGEIGVRYQPIVSVCGTDTVGVEALMHWVHPELGTIDNTELVDVSSRIEGIHRLGISVLERVCRDAQSLSDDIDLYVNVHPLEASHPDHRRRVQQALQSTGLAPSRLHLECSGGLPARGQAEYLTALRHLCSLGVRVGFDNVDREPMSLRALADTPMSFVKLTPLSRPEVLDTFARLCNVIGLRTIATNVETAEEHAQVHTARFEAAQGFHLGRPMDIERLQQRLRAERDARRAA